MAADETQRRAQQPSPNRAFGRLAVPAVALLAAVGWYAAMRMAESRLSTWDGQRSIEVASRLMKNLLERDRERMESKVSILAFNPVLSTVLKQSTERELIEQVAKTLGVLLGDRDRLAVLSVDGAMLASSIPGVDDATLRSSSVVDRARAKVFPRSESMTNVATSGFWVTEGEKGRVLEVSASNVYLGEVVGIVALAAPFADVLQDVQAISGIDGGVYVGGRLYHVSRPEMEEVFAAMVNVVPGRARYLNHGDRELIVEVEEIQKSGLGIRVAWIAEAPRGKNGWFGLLLWIPVLGAVVLGVWHGLLLDRSRRRR